jgi:hypothetical protein
MTYIDGEIEGPSQAEMGLKDKDLEPSRGEQEARHEEKTAESLSNKGAVVPIYNPDDQIKLKETDDFLKVVNTERTRVAREINKVSGIEALHDGGTGLVWAVENTDRKVGIHYQAHGVAKNPVEDLDTLITKGLSPDRVFYSMSFTKAGEFAGAFGAEMPKTEGGIIVVADYGTRFPREGDPKIKYLFLDEQYMRVVDAIQQRYEKYGVKVVPWHEVPKVLTEDANSCSPDKEKHDYKALDPKAPLRYELVEPGVPYGKAKEGEILIPRPVEKNDEIPDVW